MQHISLTLFNLTQLLSEWSTAAPISFTRFTAITDDVIEYAEDLPLMSLVTLPLYYIVFGFLVNLSLVVLLRQKFLTCTLINIKMKMKNIPVNKTIQMDIVMSKELKKLENLIGPKFRYRKLRVYPNTEPRVLIKKNRKRMK